MSSGLPHLPLRSRNGFGADITDGHGSVGTGLTGGPNMRGGWVEFWMAHPPFFDGLE